MIPLVFREPSAKRNSGIWEKNKDKRLDLGSILWTNIGLQYGGRKVELFLAQFPQSLLFTSSVQFRRVFHEDFQQTTPHGVYVD